MNNLLTAAVSALILASCSINSPSGVNNVPAGKASGVKSIFHPLGAILDNVPENGIISSFTTRFGTGSFPQSVDLSTNGFLPPVGDQGLQGSCVAWASGYYLLTYIVAHESNWNATTVSNTNNEFSPAWIYNQINGGGDNGSYPSDAFTLITLKGCDTLAYFPYDATNESDCVKQPDTASFLRAIGFQQSGWSYINMSTNSIIQELAAGIPVVIGIMVYTPDFDWLSPVNDTYDTTNAYANYFYGLTITTNNNIIFTNSNFISSFYRGEHALCLIGYDNAHNGGAFKFVNQWGTGYGVSGYGWVTYAFVNSVIREAVVFN